MDQARANHAVKYHNAARSEAKRLLVKPEQYLFCVEQAKLLRFFPTTSGGEAGRFFSLDVKRVEDYWELRVWDKILEHRNVRIMFAVFSKPREIWVLSVYAKKEQKTPFVVKARCRKRLRMLERQGYRR